MKNADEFLKWLLPWLCVYLAMIFVGLSAGTAIFDASLPMSLVFASAAITLLVVAAIFLKV